MIRRLSLVTIALLLTLAAPVAAQSLFDIFMPPSQKSSERSFRVEYVEGDESSEHEILLIRIKGVITDSSNNDRLPFEMRRDFMETLRKEVELALERKRVKAVLLEIDSPGGEVTASDIVHHRLGGLKDAKKPVVALFGSVGASGAYYVACVADRILAHPTSIIGSIGVIMQTANLEKLAETIGYKHISLKSDRTPKKDVLSPFREMTAAERAMLMTIVDSMHDRFIDIVAKGRNLPREDVTALADGSVYTAAQCLDKKLIDAIGYRDDAIKAAMELAEIDSAKLVKRHERKSLPEMLREMSEMHSGAPAVLGYVQTLLESQGSLSLRYQLFLPTP
jgi:protease IV